MAVFSRGYTWGATETVTNAKLHALVDSATITGIVDADVAVGANIAFSKIAQTDIDGSKLTGLGNIVSGAGVIPKANLTSVAQKGANSDITSLTGLTTALSTAQGGTGSTANANAASGVVVLDASSKLPAVDGSQLTGVVGETGIKGQLFTSSGTWTKPTGITSVLVKLIGGGGETGSSGVTGTTGGTSSFAGTTTISATGGTGGSVSVAGVGGTGTGGYIACTGETAINTSAYVAKAGGFWRMANTYGQGGASVLNSYYGGGGGGFAEGIIAVTGNVTVTVGAGGTGNPGADGIAGCVIVYY